MRVQVGELMCTSACVRVRSYMRVASAVVHASVGVHASAVVHASVGVHVSVVVHASLVIQASCECYRACECGCACDHTKVQACLYVGEGVRGHAFSCRPQAHEPIGLSRARPAGCGTT